MGHFVYQWSKKLNEHSATAQKNRSEASDCEIKTLKMLFYCAISKMISCVDQLPTSTYFSAYYNSYSDIAQQP
jgi:hypothetical protein